MTLGADSATCTALGSHFKLEQVIRYDYTKPISNLRQQLIVIPRLRHGAQHRRSWELSVTGTVTFRRQDNVDSFGNKVISLVCPQVRESVEFRVSATMTRGTENHIVRRDDRYLWPTRLTELGTSLAEAVRRWNAPPTAGELCSFVYRTMTYRPDATGVRTTAEEAFELGGGVCQDYAHIMIALCRAAAIPARYVSGHLLGEGGSHAWVEVFVPDQRDRSMWTVQAWHPTHDRRTHDGYVTIAVGKDYGDVAPMSGSFRAGAAHGMLRVDKRLTRAAA